MKVWAQLCQALSLVFNDLCLFVIFASAAFQRPNNGGFAEKRRNTQNFKQLKNSVPKMCPN